PSLGMGLSSEHGRARPRLLAGEPWLYDRRPVSSLGLAVRAITGSSRLLPSGREAAHARLTLLEGARGLASSRRQARARDHLAAMVGEILKEESFPPSQALPRQGGGRERDATWLRSCD